MKWVTMFPQCTNTRLIKDVGMVPYEFCKKTKWDTSIACYIEDKKFPYLEKEVKGIRIEEIRKYTGRPILDGIFFLLKNAQKIDLLQLYHLTSERNYWWVRVYKFLNPKGRVYLKLDTNYDILYMQLTSWQRWMIRNCEFISAETLDIAAKLEAKWKREVMYVANGVYWEDNKLVDWSEKENIILTVGRIGSFQKNIELLLDIFNDLQKENKDYKLRVVGPIEKEFEKYIENFFELHPALKDKVFFLGDICDRNMIEDEYRKAKYFLFTSRWESFGIAIAEALMAGCYVVSSEVETLQMIINNKYGVGFPLKDRIKGVEALKQAINRSAIDSERICREAQLYARDAYSWETIMQPIIEAITK